MKFKFIFFCILMNGICAGGSSNFPQTTSEIDSNAKQHQSTSDFLGMFSGWMQRKTPKPEPKTLQEEMDEANLKVQVLQEEAKKNELRQAGEDFTNENWKEVYIKWEKKQKAEKAHRLAKLQKAKEEKMKLDMEKKKQKMEKEIRDSNPGITDDALKTKLEKAIALEERQKQAAKDHQEYMQKELDRERRNQQRQAQKHYKKDMQKALDKASRRKKR